MADVILVGAGIMSATLAVCLKELQPALTLELFEALDGAAHGSSNAWNNAGTGHAALCELNYTPERSEGSIDISKGARRERGVRSLAAAVGASVSRSTSRIRGAGGFWNLEPSS